MLFDTMAKYTGSLPPIKMKSDQHEALKWLADQDQTSMSTLVRQALSRYLEIRGVDLMRFKNLEEDR